MQFNFVLFVALSIVVNICIGFSNAKSIHVEEVANFEALLSHIPLLNNSDKYDDDRLELEDGKLTAPQLITKYGYPVEVHAVITEDGYILEVHRIPYGKAPGSGPSENKPVVWLQHGILADSSNWILNEEHKAVAYVLADAGYDVWLGNARGNTYSKKHISLNPNRGKYWQFSWYQMGKYDIPAVLNYIVDRTQQPNLHYIGHSMGCTMFFTAMIEYPELQSKIRLMTALAPVAYLDHARTPLVLMSPFANSIEWIGSFLGINEFLPSNWLMEFLGAAFCKENNPFQFVCSNILFLISGYNVDQLNKTALPILMSHTPAGASVKTIVHFAQVINSGKFRQYNHGIIENLIVYGQVSPPLLDLTKVQVPIAIYYGENDWLAGPKDVAKLAGILPNVVRHTRINHDKYSHLDFLWAIDNDKLLVEPVLEFLRDY